MWTKLVAIQHSCLLNLHKSSLPNVLWILGGLLWSLLPLSSSHAQGKEDQHAGASFGKEIQPFLTKYCIGCHGAKTQKANFRLDTLDTDLLNGNAVDMWQEVLDLINVSEMPPKDADPQPTSKEREAATNLLTTEFRRVLETRRIAGGRSMLRRLTAYEYSNTLRDLLGLDLQFAKDLPPEGTAKEGFKNNSTVLGTSALHMEYFERIARSALTRILVTPEEKPLPYIVRIEPERAFNQNPVNGNANRDQTSYNLQPLVGGKPSHKALFKLSFGDLALNGDGIVLAGNRSRDPLDAPFAAGQKRGGALGDGRSGWQPEFTAEIYEIPPDAPVRITIRAAAILGQGNTFPRLSFELGSFRGNGVSDQKEGGNIEVRSREFQTYEFVVHGANFPFQSNKPSRPSYFRIFNEFRRGTSKLTYEELPKLIIDWVEIESNYYPEWPTAQKNDILIGSAPIGNEDVYVREVLRNFMFRAYRRPVADHEVERKVALYAKLRPTHATLEHALVSTLTSVLCSSNFLLIAEPRTAEGLGDDSSEPRHISGFELASRLSYFLWSSMPDDELFKLAQEDQLNKPSILRSQVLRMLRDTKAGEFSKNFTSQWLDLEGIRRLAVNPEYFDFEEKTKDLFEAESIHFFHHVFSNNLSIDNFIASDFAALNHKLAKHYRIPGISGGFEIQELDPQHHRGGFLTQASILFGNSTGADTHPIRRGMWILERILDDPPPPPPPDVPDLEEPEAQDVADLSLKERLTAHTNVQSCRDCHSKIDPWGLAFENYNALGQWRSGDFDPNVKPAHQQISVDATTQLRNGHKIQHLDDLKHYILTDKKEQYRRTVVRKVMSYALGRYLDFQDRPAIDAICDTLATDEDKFQTLIIEIVLSEPFLTK